MPQDQVQDFTQTLGSTLGIAQMFQGLQQQKMHNQLLAQKVQTAQQFQQLEMAIAESETAKNYAQERKYLAEALEPGQRAGREAAKTAAGAFDFAEIESMDPMQRRTTIAPLLAQIMIENDPQYQGADPEQLQKLAQNPQFILQADALLTQAARDNKMENMKYQQLQSATMQVDQAIAQKGVDMITPLLQMRSQMGPGVAAGALEATGGAGVMNPYSGESLTPEGLENIALSRSAPDEESEIQALPIERREKVRSERSGRRAVEEKSVSEGRQSDLDLKRTEGLIEQTRAYTEKLQAETQATKAGSSDIKLQLEKIKGLRERRQQINNQIVALEQQRADLASQKGTRVEEELNSIKGQLNSLRSLIDGSQGSEGFLGIGKSEPVSGLNQMEDEILETLIKKQEEFEKGRQRPELKTMSFSDFVASEDKAQFVGTIVVADDGSEMIVVNDDKLGGRLVKLERQGKK